MSASPPVQTNAHLAGLLADAFAEVEQLKSDRDTALHRAQNAEQLLQAATAPTPTPAGSSPNNDAQITALQSLNATHQRTIAELNSRLKAIFDAWLAYDHWCSTLDARNADARAVLRKTISGLVAGSDVDAGSPLPPRDVQPFQIPSLSRKTSRTAGIYPHHPSFQIPPGAPGGRPTSQVGVPANLPPVPIPSGTVVPRVRPREDSVPRRRSDDEPSARRDPAAPGASDAEERSHRLSADDADSVHDHLSEGERQRKRLRADPGPAPSASAPPPNRRDRAHFTDSPHSSSNQFSPQFTFPHSQPAYPPPHSAQQRPSHPDQIRPRAPDAPATLHIGDRGFMRHHPRHGSDSTLPSAITPTSAATSASRTSGSGHIGPQTGSRDSFTFVRGHARSGDVRMDSLGDASSMMIGGLRVDSPPPMDAPQRQFSDRMSYHEKEQEGRRRESDRPRPDSMDVDDGGEVRRSRKGERGDDDDKNSVDELLLATAIDPVAGADGQDEDQLRDDDREMSPMSISISQRHRRNLSATEVERWKERDRMRDLEREGEDHGGEQHVHYPGPNGLVKVKEKSGDKFRHYLYSSTSPSTSPHLPPSSASQNFPMTATFTLSHGQLTQTGRRGTIAGLVTTPSEREFNYSSRASFQAQHSRRHSNDIGPPSSNVSHPSLSGPASAGGPLSAGPSTSILYPHSQQPRHTGPGPAVKPTLNAQGQRTCRQCGQPGRYKDGKCVEKWGPGPAGPGTVCDRCRKKMKRVERRGTQDAAGLGQAIPLVPLAASQSQVVSPRQFYNAPYPRSPGADVPQREYQFQTPLSANSSTWHRNSKDFGDRSARPGSVVTSPPQSAKSRDRDLMKPPKEKRRAPEYSESPSPGPMDDLAKVASPSRSIEEEPAAPAMPSASPVSSTQRKNSGDSSFGNDMERAAEHLMVELDDDVEVSPAGTMVKEKDGEDDADADGDLEDAVGEEEDADPDIAVVDSDPSPQQRPSAAPASRKPSSRTAPANGTAVVVVREKEQNLKPGWVKLEEDGIAVA